MEMSIVFPYDKPWLDCDCETQKENVMKVELTYFTPTGKYYTNVSYDSELQADEPLFRFWEELRDKFNCGERPGLVDGTNDYFIVLVNVPGHVHEHPVLLLPPDLKSPDRVERVVEVEMEIE